MSKFKDIVFEKDFHTFPGDPSLDGFRIQKLYHGVGKDAIRYSDGYGITFPLPGNIQLLRMPDQADGEFIILQSELENP